MNRATTERGKRKKMAWDMQARRRTAEAGNASSWPTWPAMNSTTLLIFGLICLPSGFALAQSQTAAQRNLASPATTVTFNQDIATIIHDKCSNCHRPGQGGPFSLLTYDDVARRAQTIDAVIDSGYMPPWKPVNHGVEFAKDRRLTATQKESFKRWIAEGKPRGDGPEPALPVFRDGWALGEPDLVVRMNGEFTVPASGPDIYRSFVFPLQLDEDKWIKAIEYRPSARSSVHHALFLLDRHGNARKMDGADGNPGIAGMGFLSDGAMVGDERDSGGNGLAGLGGLILSRRRQASPGRLDQTDFANRLSAGLGGYVPGTTPTTLPGDLALSLPQGSDIVMQTHFHPSGKVEVEKGEIAIYFADQKPSKRMIPIQIPAMFGVGVGLKVPAGERDYRVRESFQVPVDIELISIGAHAHYICQHASMTAALPDGTTQVLLEIDDWDLDWQDIYYFNETITLPAGTVLTTELVYDNSADNPENPFNPPRDIRWGRESTDEMGSVTLQAVAVDESQRPHLESALRRYFYASLTQGDLIQLLMQLDTNRDGGLQRSEAPPRMADRFQLLDRNGDQKLDPSELEIIRRFLPKPEGTK